MPDTPRHLAAHRPGWHWWHELDFLCHREERCQHLCTLESSTPILLHQCPMTWLRSVDRPHQRHARHAETFGLVAAVLSTSPNVPNFSLGSVSKYLTALLVSRSCTNETNADFPFSSAFTRSSFKALLAMEPELRGHLPSQMDSSIDWSPPWPSARLLHPLLFAAQQLLSQALRSENMKDHDQICAKELPVRHSEWGFWLSWVVAHAWESWRNPGKHSELDPVVVK